MQCIPVASSNILCVGYDPASMTLEVEFHHGGIYQYFAVPEHLHHGLMTATSKGRYLDDHVKKGGFAYDRVG